MNFDLHKSGLECDASQVRTEGQISFTNSIKKCCQARNDEWAFNVAGKIEFFSDLHAADVVYHKTCSINFRTGRKIPVRYSMEKKKKGGRPENTIQRNAFLLSCEYFESNIEEQTSLSELISKMDEFLQDTEYSAYDPRHMRRKLEEFYGQDILITGGSGLATLLTYRKNANSILREFYNTPKNQDIALQKIQLIESAAELIISDVKEICDSSKIEYPHPEDLTVDHLFDFLPNS